MVFSGFFYFLRESGLKVSLDEWMTLMEALDKGLAGSSLNRFFYLSRAVLIKSEGDYDTYGRLFSAYFQGVSEAGGIPDQLWDFLSSPIEQMPYDKGEVDARTDLDYQELQELLEIRLQEQKNAHNGGNRWIGTGGTSPLGNSGYAMNGFRIGEYSRHNSALAVIAKQNYRDFREDETIDIRHFQTALRRLRQFSSRYGQSRDELDIDATVRKTCENAGMLRLVYDYPRKNTVKLLTLFDSGGSMEKYARLCSQLFQAVSRENHFKDLKIYYFHNCPYNKLYKTPACSLSESVDTEWLLKNVDDDYRILFVGDASMASWELRYYNGSRRSRVSDNVSPVAWLSRLADNYQQAVWLNPIPQSQWDSARGKTTIEMIRSVVSMYPLSVEGLEKGIRKLLGAR
ncbi:MAG: VWA domain-containing protein [Anaerovoracaceae bacterium]|nr:VWA domain-containing protein [Anaerovoracaceae bacterium]